MNGRAPVARSGPSVLVTVVLVETGLFILALGLSWYTGLSLSPGPLLSGVALGLLATLPPWWLIIRLGRSRRGWARALLDWVDRNLGPLFRDCSVPSLAVIALMAGLGEELLFRGILQQGLQGWLGPWSGLLLASLAFGIAHGVNRLYLFFGCLMGLYLGLLYWFTGSLLAVVLAHAFYDFLALRRLRGQGLVKPDGEGNGCTSEPGPATGPTYGESDSG